VAETSGSRRVSEWRSGTGRAARSRGAAAGTGTAATSLPHSFTRSLAHCVTQSAEVERSAVESNQRSAERVSDTYMQEGS
jgi:hypothetical protein